MVCIVSLHWFVWYMSRLHWQNGLCVQGSWCCFWGDPFGLISHFVRVDCEVNALGMIVGMQCLVLESGEGY